MSKASLSTSRHVSTSGVLKALSNENRLQVLEWLLDPVSHFPAQVDGDLIEDGVCLGAIVRKLGVSQPTVTGYMRTLTEAGLVSQKKIKNWVFFKPRHDVIAASLADLSERLSRSPTSEDA
jgi:DNA-binding transcriptional ArsR family regulator